ncbi:hypothetical protein [Dokdonia sp. Asnod3-C12]|uniref:hypothetical protein n=1 Tax=Dokdonia sp. Asnod3-C12 TaxID=3160575 RepID=UPI00386EAD51
MSKKNGSNLGSKKANNNKSGSAKIVRLADGKASKNGAAGLKGLRVTVRPKK